MESKETLVYSDDLCRKIDIAISEAEGDKELVLCKLFSNACAYSNAREYSITIAKCFGMTELEFMQSWKKLKYVARQKVNAASRSSATRARKSGDSGSR